MNNNFHGECILMISFYNDIKFMDDIPNELIDKVTLRYFLKVQPEALQK